MKTTSLLVIIASIISLPSIGQFTNNKIKAKVSMSEPFPVHDGMDISETIDGNQYRLTIARSGECTLQKFSLDPYKEISSKEIEGFQVKDVIYFFTSTTSGDFIRYLIPSEDKKSFNVCVRKINYTASNPVGPEKIVKTINHPMPFGYSLDVKPTMGFGYGVYKTGDITNLKLERSSDKDNVMVSYRVVPGEKNDSKNKDIYKYHFFDENYDLVWEKEIQMPYTENQMSVIQSFMDDKDGQFSLIKYYPNTVRDRKTYAIQLIKISENGENITTINSELGGDKYNVDFRLSVNNEGNAVLNTIYTKEDKHSIGLLTQVLDNSGDIINETITDIPLSVSQLYTTNQKEKSNGGTRVSNNAEFEEIHFDSEGNSTFIINYGFNNDEGYLYETSFIVLQLDNKNELNWVKSLPKAIRYNLNSYRTYFNEDNFELFFIGDPLCNDLTPADKSARIGEKYISSYTVDNESGDAVRTTYFNYSKIDKVGLYQYSPYDFIQISEHEFYFKCYKKKKEDIFVKFGY